MGLREVKSELKKLDKETLIKHIAELYKKFNPVKEYLDFCFNQDESALLEVYKEKVREGFYPKRGHRLNLSISKKAINDFKKLETSKESLANLLLYYVECGVEFTNDFGDINEKFYISIAKTYSESLELMRKTGILSEFKSSVLKLIEATKNVGWGLHYHFKDVYAEYYFE